MTDNLGNFNLSQTSTNQVELPQLKDESEAPLMPPALKDSWEPKFSKVKPIGYFNKDAEGTWYPNPEVLFVLEQALDQLDNGISYREAQEFFNAHVGPEDQVSHVGLIKIRNRVRPNFVRKQPSPKKPRHIPWEERKEISRKKKIAVTKRQILAANKRISRMKEEIGIIQEDREELKKPLTEFVPTVDYDYSVLPDEEELVVFKPNPGPQTAFLAATEQEVLYGGAAGGAKSFGLLADPLRYFGNKNFNGLLLRRTNDELRELIMKSHQLYPAAYPGAKWGEKKSLWTFPSGAQLWFTYLERDEDVYRYQGQSFCWIGFDELTQYPTPFAWNYLSSRLRTVDPELPLSQRGTSNPGGPGHGWVKRMFIDPAPWGQPFGATNIDTNETLVVEENDPDFPPEQWGKPLFYRKFIPAKLADNPYLADGRYRRNLLALPENQRRQLLDGDWSVAEGAAFPEFRYSTHTCKPFPIPDSWRKFRSCDYGYASFSAVHWYAVSPENILYVYRELYTSKKTGAELGQIILNLERDERVDYGVLDGSVWAERGTSGPSIADDILKTGCRFRPSDRKKGSRQAGFTRLHELLKVDEFTGKPGIIFFDTCRQIIADLPIIPLSKDVADDIDIRYTSDHAYDSIRYGIQSRPKAFSVFDIEGRNQNNYRPFDRVFGY